MRVVPRLSRRWFLGGIAGTSAALAIPAGADEAIFTGDGLAPRTPLDLDVRDLKVPGPPGLADRFTLYTPKHLAPGERVPLLVLLHGLSETWSSEIGVHAWVQRYGLGNAYARLRRP